MRSASASVMGPAKVRRGGTAFASVAARDPFARDLVAREALATDFRVENRQPCQANIPATHSPNIAKETTVDARDGGRVCCQPVRKDPVCKEPKSCWSGCAEPGAVWPG